MPHHEGIHATGCASPKTCIVNVDLFPEKMNLLLDWISRQALLDPVFQDPYPHSIRIPLEWFPSVNQTWPVRNIIHVQQPFMDDCPTKRSHSPVRCLITRGLYNVIYIYIYYILLQHQFYWAPKSALTSEKQHVLPPNLDCCREKTRTVRTHLTFWSPRPSSNQT